MFLPNANLIVDVTPTVLNSDAYDAGDVLFDTTEITNAVPYAGGNVLLQSLTVLDKDDQAAAAMTLYFLQTDVSLGTKDAAVSITDANATEILGVVPIAVGDWSDLINSRLACIKNVGLLLQAAPTSKHLYVAATTAGTPTQTTGGIVLTFGFRWLK